MTAGPLNIAPAIDDVMTASLNLNKKFGPIGARRFATQLMIAVGLRPSQAKSTMITRVRWRGDWWQAHSAVRSRTFIRPADAERFAERLRAEAYDVEISKAERSPWLVIERAPFTPRTVASLHPAGYQVSHDGTPDSHDLDDLEADGGPA